jgi:hypothetical protein
MEARRCFFGQLQQRRGHCQRIFAKAKFYSFGPAKVKSKSHKRAGRTLHNKFKRLTAASTY